MRSNPNPSARPGETRRQFIKQTGLAAAAVAGGGFLPLPVSAAESKPPFAILLDETDTIGMQPQVQWAVEQLRDALTARGFAAEIYQKFSDAPPANECVLVAGRASHRARCGRGENFVAGQLRKRWRWRAGKSANVPCCWPPVRMRAGWFMRCSNWPTA